MFICMVLFVVFCRAQTSEERVYTANAKAILETAKQVPSLEQLKETLQAKGIENVNESSRQFAVRDHEKTLLPFSPQEIDWLFVLRVAGATIAVSLFLYTFRVLCLARQRRLYGIKSSIALPVDYRLQKKRVMAMESAKQE